jgi:hypothetical protein
MQDPDYNYNEARADEDVDLINENLRDFLRGFRETSQTGEDYDEQWAGFSRQLGDKERREIEAGGYDSGLEMGRQFHKTFGHEIREEEDDQ